MPLQDAFQGISDIITVPHQSDFAYVKVAMKNLELPCPVLVFLPTKIGPKKLLRSEQEYKMSELTDIKIDIKCVPKKTTLIKAMEEADVKTKWENSSWGKKLIVQKRRASLTQRT
ncbi:60S ribosomal protein L14-1 [Zea mays]|uniref:60S ribosomal protein L14-1 n=1 Tax=Zea mays TaxID=4577 RepID=A0A1D6PAU5_MAIZE|nr:60S ribosomal protein L14-1 [Zea mays]